MSATQLSLDVLSLLHDQYRIYTTALSQTHDALARQYKKIKKLQEKLHSLVDQPASRTARRKATWTRTLAMQNMTTLIGQQAELFGLIQQCRDLIVTYHTAAYTRPATPSTIYMPMTPYSVFSFDHLQPTPWTAHCVCSDDMNEAPQYWDLSRLRDSLVTADLDAASYQSEIDQQTTTGHEQQDWSYQYHGTGSDTTETIECVGRAASGPKLLMPRGHARAVSTIRIDTEQAKHLHRRRHSEHLTRSTWCEQVSSDVDAAPASVREHLSL